MHKNEKAICYRMTCLCRHFRRFDDRYKAVKIPFRSLKDLCAIPIVSKADLRGYSVASPFNITATSGTTAERLVIVHSQNCYRTHIKRLMKIYQSVGISLGDLCLNLCAYDLNSGGRLMETAFKAMGVGVIPVGVLDSPIKIEEVASLIKIFKPTVVNSYTNQLFDLFSQLGRQHSIRMCIVNGEPLSRSFKSRIEAISGAKVHNHYGAMEFSGLAIAQKHTDEYMKIFDDGLFIEVLHDDGRVSQTGEGAILVTDLKNISMPFIRYKLGDRVEIRKSRGELYVQVLGRLSDSVLIQGEIYSSAEISAVGQDILGHPHFFFIINKNQETYSDSVILNIPERDILRALRVRGVLAKRFSFGNRLDIRPYKGAFPKTTTGKFKHVIDAR